MNTLCALKIQMSFTADLALGKHDGFKIKLSEV